MKEFVSFLNRVDSSMMFALSLINNGESLMRYQLKKVVWEITWKCNAKCIHCGSDCISVEKEHQLTTAECLDIVADLKQLGTEVIFLSGGDPLLREDFGAIAAAIKSHGMKVAFISNALAINDDTIKVLKSIKVKKKTNEYIPFGPFIVLATFIVMCIPSNLLITALLEIFTLGMYQG